METHEVIARIMELVNQEPRYFRELVRIFRDEEGYTFNYWVERVAEAVTVAILDGRLQRTRVTNGKLFTSTVWTPYSIYTPVDEPPMGWEEYEKRAEDKLRKLSRISDIGYKNAELFEKLVYNVVKKFYPHAVRSPFKSPLPDIYVPGENLIVEATTRFEYPVTRNYVLWKYYHLGVPNQGLMTDRPYDEPYFSEKPLKMLIVAPIVGKSAWDFLKKQRDPKEGIPQAVESGMNVIKIIQFPKTDRSHAGWPLFRTYAYYKKWLEEFHRKVYLLSYRDAEKRLTQAIRNAVNNWKQQEEVLISSRTYND